MVGREDVIQQRGLTAAQESRDYRDRNALGPCIRSLLLEDGIVEELHRGVTEGCMGLLNVAFGQ